MADYRGIDIKEYAENGLADVAGLLSRREYGLSIVRARQIEERLIRSYALERGIEYTTLADTIEQLYAGGFINMASRDAYHTIRLYGNKIVHESAENEEDAQSAYYLLKNEIQTYLSRKDVSVDRTPIRVDRNTRGPVQEDRYSSESRSDGDERRDWGLEDMPRRNTEGSQRKTDRDRSERSDRDSYNRDRDRRNRDGRRRERDYNAEEERGGINIYDILRIIIPVVVVILIVIIIRSLLPSKPTVTETSSQPVVTVEQTEPETEETETEPETTEPETEAPVVNYKIIDDGTNIRYADNQDRIYTQLAAGTVIGAVTPIEGSDFVQFTLDGVSVVVRKDLITKAE